MLGALQGVTNPADSLGQYKSAKTSIVKKNLSPDWGGEKLAIECTDPRNEILYVCVWDFKGRIKLDVLMGEAIIDIQELKIEATRSVSAQLSR
jgi:hypothetical protein